MSLKKLMSQVRCKLEIRKWPAVKHSNDFQVKPEKVLRNNYAKILRDFSIQTNMDLFHSQADIALINYNTQTDLVIGITVLKEGKIQEKISIKLTNISFWKLSSNNCGNSKSR